MDQEGRGGCVPIAPFDPPMHVYWRTQDNPQKNGHKLPSSTTNDTNDIDGR